MECICEKRKGKVFGGEGGECDTQPLSRIFCSFSIKTLGGGGGGGGGVATHNH